MLAPRVTVLSSTTVAPGEATTVRVGLTGGGGIHPSHTLLFEPAEEGFAGGVMGVLGEGDYGVLFVNEADGEERCFVVGQDLGEALPCVRAAEDVAAAEEGRPPVPEMTDEQHRNLVRKWAEALPLPKDAESARGILVQVLVFYHSVFHVAEDDSQPLSSIRNVKFHAQLIPGASAVFRMAIRCPPKDRERTAWHTQNAVDQDRWLLVPCSEWGAPAFTVDKTNCPEGRQVVDYRLTNKVLRRFHFSIPHMWDILSRVSGAHFLSVMDAKSGFRQVEYTEDAKKIFTVSTWEGLFQPQRLEMGPHNGPEAFQCLMHVIFGKLLWKSLLIFIDDLVSFTHVHRPVGAPVLALAEEAVAVLIWNSNGLVKRHKAAPELLGQFFRQHQLLILSETRMSGERAVALVDWIQGLGFAVWYSEGPVAGQAGLLVAVSRSLGAPLSVEEYEPGRGFELVFADFTLCGVYAPQSGSSAERAILREDWDLRARARVSRLKALGRPFLYAGDLNVAAEERDCHKGHRYTPSWRRGAVAAIAAAWGVSREEAAGWPSCTRFERDSHARFLEAGSLQRLSAYGVTWRDRYTRGCCLDYLYGFRFRRILGRIGDLWGSDHNVVSTTIRLVGEHALALGDGEGPDQPGLAADGDIGQVLKFSGEPLPPERLWPGTIPKDLSFEVREHLRGLVLLFTTAARWNVKLAAKKSAFFSHEEKVLGTMVGRRGITAEADRCEAILAWPEPETRKEVRQFVGVVGFVRPFLGAEYSKKMAPLHRYNTDATPKRFKLDAAAAGAFREIKQLVVRRVRLLRPDYQACLDAVARSVTAGLFEVFADICDYAAGGGLTQVQGEARAPLAFASGSLTAGQMLWPVGMRELWGCKFCSEKFAPLVYGFKTIYWTDHANLLRLDRVELTRTNGMVLRWYISIRSSGGELRNLQGRANRLGDGLSRNPSDMVAAKARLESLRTGLLQDVGGELAFTVEEWCLQFATCSADVWLSTSSEPSPGAAVLEEVQLAFCETSILGGVVLGLSEQGEAVRSERLLFVPDYLSRSLEGQADDLRARLRGYPGQVSIVVAPPLYEDRRGDAYWFSKGQRATEKMRVSEFRKQLLAGVVGIVRTLAAFPATLLVGAGQGGLMVLAIFVLFEAALEKVQVQADEARELRNALVGLRRVVAVRPHLAGQADWEELCQAGIAGPIVLDDFPARFGVVLEKFSSVFEEVTRIAVEFGVDVARVPAARGHLPVVDLEWYAEEPVSVCVEVLTPLEEAEDNLSRGFGALRTLIAEQQANDPFFPELRRYLEGAPIPRAQYRVWAALLPLYRIAESDKAIERRVGRGPGLWVIAVPQTEVKIEFPRGEIVGRSLRSATSSTLRHYLLFQLHHSLAGGHRPAGELFPLARRMLYWEHLGKDIHHWCDEICLPCSRRRRTGRIGYYKMREIRGGPFRWCQVDLVGPINPPGEGKYRYILTYICVFTRYVYLRPVQDKSAEEVAQCLLLVFFECGTWPLVLQSDNGSEFVNWIMAELLRISSVCHVKGAAYTPRIQGIVEASHRSLNAGLCVLVCEFLAAFPNRWSQLLPALQYHARMKPLLGRTCPHEMVHGWVGVSPLEASLMPVGSEKLDPEIEGTWLADLHAGLRDLHTWFEVLSDEKQERIRAQHDKGAFRLRFSVGEWVVVEKPILDRTRGSALCNWAVGIGRITFVSADDLSVTVAFDDTGRIEEKVATSRLIRYPFVPRHSPGPPTYEVRGRPLLREDCLGISRGGFVVYGVQNPGEEEMILVGQVLSNLASESKVWVHEYRDKGDGPVRGRAWRPQFVQASGAAGFRHSENACRSPVAYTRIYADFDRFLRQPANRLPPDVVDELEAERGIQL